MNGCGAKLRQSDQRHSTRAAALTPPVEVAAAAEEQEQHNDNDDECRGIHSYGQPFSIPPVGSASYYLLLPEVVRLRTRDFCINPQTFASEGYFCSKASRCPSYGVCYTCNALEARRAADA